MWRPLISVKKGLVIELGPPAFSWYDSSRGVMREVTLGPMMIFNFVPKKRGINRGKPRSSGIRSSKPVEIETGRQGNVFFICTYSTHPPTILERSQHLSASSPSRYDWLPIWIWAVPSVDVDGLWLQGRYVAIALDLAEASEVYENITSVESISLHALCLQSYTRRNIPSLWRDL